MSRQELLNRYDKWFGKGTGQKLLNAQKMYSRDQYLRVNLSKTSVSKIKKFLKSHRVKFSDTPFENGIKIDKSFFNLSSTLPSLNGEMYLQDLASQVPIHCINFEELKKKKFVSILDMAASPGSKTTQLADFLNLHNIKYSITALEPDKKRITKLINNIQKQGFENIEIFNCKGQDFRTKKPFDIVILDAPCSGNLVGDHKWLNKRNVRGIKENSTLQKRLLESAFHLVKKNGLIIYSTCSLEIEENEDNVRWFSQKYKVKSFRPNLKLHFDTKAFKDNFSLRFMPHKTKMQGFFVSCFRKN